MQHLKHGLVAVALTVGMAPAFAGLIMLDVTFSNYPLATVDSDLSPIWTGSIANESSPDAVMSFLNGNHVVLDVAAGFDTGLSFYYSPSAVASVTVYDGLDATGKVLARLPLSAQFNLDCTVDAPVPVPEFSEMPMLAAGVAAIGLAARQRRTGLHS